MLVREVGRVIWRYCLLDGFSSSRDEVFITLNVMKPQRGHVLVGCYEYEFTSYLSFCSFNASPYLSSRNFFTLKTHLIKEAFLLSVFMR